MIEVKSQIILLFPKKTLFFLPSQLNADSTKYVVASAEDVDSFKLEPSKRGTRRGIFAETYVGRATPIRG